MFESTHLRADGVGHAYEARRILTDVSFVVPAARPTGLIGENGSGKSTLLRLLAGVETPDSGTVEVPGPVGLLWQELPFAPTASLAEVMADALTAPRAAEAALAATGDALAAADAAHGADSPAHRAAAAAYDEALRTAVAGDVWDAPQRRDRVLAGLGLDGIDPARAIGRLSGGQRSRLALAWLLVTRPTTLLLDEPTNHLDDAGAEFLARTLGEHPGPVLLASHDRAFLDEATVALLDLDPAPRTHAVERGLDRAESGHGVTAFTGNYTDHVLARMAQRERWERQYRDEQEELRRLAAQARDSHQVGHAGAAPRTEAKITKKFYSDKNARVVSRRVKDATARHEELKENQVRKPPTELHFTGLPAARAGSGVLLAAAGVHVDGRLAPTDLAVSAGEKWLVTGANGSGKSTLLRVLTGALKPDGGTVSRPRGLRMAVLAQDVAMPDPGATVRAVLGGDPAGPAPELFGLVHPRDLNRAVGALSVGQVRRVELARLLADPPDLLVLDEPTNHLSLDLATLLEQAVQDWSGTVLVASHDRWLRRRWTGLHLALAGRD